MMRASILILLAVAVCGAQAFWPLDLFDKIKECPESTKFDGPLERTAPHNYMWVLSLGEANKWEHAGAVIVGVKFDDELSSKKDEPKNVIVLHKDASVKVDDLTVWDNPKDPKTGSPLEKVRVAIKKSCHISSKQLLVIELEEEIADKAELDVLFGIKAPIRKDGKGIYREGDLIKGSFASHEARLAIPCFDDDKYKSKYQGKLSISSDYTAFSETCGIHYQYIDVPHKLVSFLEKKNASLSEFTFELKLNKH